VASIPGLHQFTSVAPGETSSSSSDSEEDFIISQSSSDDEDDIDSEAYFPSDTEEVEVHATGDE
jgi:hypothetical protein